MKCLFCPATVPTTEDAISAGWFPSFWAGEYEVPHPVCEECQCRYLVWDERSGLPYLPAVAARFALPPH